MAGAKAEATRRADEFVASLPDHNEWRHISTNPDTFDPPRSSSKHPMTWVATYVPIPPCGSVIDGGELFVIVDLELGRVGPLDFWGRG